MIKQLIEDIITDINNFIIRYKRKRVRDKILSGYKIKHGERKKGNGVQSTSHLSIFKRWINKGLELRNDKKNNTRCSTYPFLQSNISRTSNKANGHECKNPKTRNSTRANGGVVKKRHRRSWGAIQGGEHTSAQKKDL